jgi:uncharacterized protein (DUF433 family)
MNDRLTIDPGVMCDKPCIRGTRIPVYIILNLIAGGYTIDKILQTYPRLTREDVLAAVSYAGSLAEREDYHPQQKTAI